MNMENMIISKPIRYEKNSILYINEEEISLITYLKKKRNEKKITKKYISNVIKNNDYWYSQIEMGKKDDNRRKYINRHDLINIISVIIYDAKSPIDLERFYSNSENYIDNIMKVVSYDQEIRIKPLYELVNEANKYFSTDYNNNRLKNCLNDLNSIIKEFYDKCNPIEKDSIINLLNTLILNLSLEPIITLHYYGIPFCSFFSAKSKNKQNKDLTDENIIKDIDDIIARYSQLLCENDMEMIIKRLSYHLYNTEKLINNPFSL